MNSGTIWPRASSRPARPWLSAVVLAGHALLLWALLQSSVIEAAVQQAAVLTVHIVSPERAPAPPQPPQVKVRHPALPPVAVAAPVPEVHLQHDNPPSRLAGQAVQASVVPSAAPALLPLLPPAPPPAPAIQKLPASALRYLVEPVVEVPRLSRRLRESGTVRLRVVFDVRGLPRSVTLQRSSGFERLDQHALAAMRQARLVPCTEGGQPVECEADAPIEYPLEN